MTKDQFIKLIKSMPDFEKVCITDKYDSKYRIWPMGVSVENIELYNEETGQRKKFKTLIIR